MKETRKIVLLNMRKYGVWLIWLGCLIWMASGFPFTGDDFFRVRSGSPAIYEIIDYTVHLWKNTNGRVLGNLFSFLWIDYPAIMAVIKGGTIFIIAALICRITDTNSRFGCSLVMATVLFLPLPMFRQVYPWTAGFFNYVPPVLLILFAMWIMKDKMHNDTGKDSLLIIPGMLVLGMATCLFVENITLVVVAGGLLTMIVLRNHKRYMALVGSYTVGAFIGAVSMFSSPVYRNSLSGSDSYRSVAFSLHALLYQIAKNYRIISLNLLHHNFILLSFLALVGIGSFWIFTRKKKKTLLHKIWIVGVLYFLCVRFLPGYLQMHTLVGQLKLYTVFFDAVMLAIVVIPLFILMFTEKNYLGLIFMGTMIGTGMPLLIVSPIGPRNVYALHILLVCLLFTILNPLIKELKWDQRTYGTVSMIIVLCLTGYYCYVFTLIGNTQALQYQHIREQMELGVSKIEIPQYPYPQFIYGPHGEKIRYLFYYNKPFDLEISFIPKEAWDSKWK